MEEGELLLEFFSLLLSCVELVDAGRFEESLFTSVERVALEAGFYLHFVTLDSTEGFEAVSARTDYLDLVVIWVDILFHRKKIVASA